MPFFPNQRFVLLDNPQDFVVLVRRKITPGKSLWLHPDFRAAIFFSNVHMDGLAAIEADEI